MKKKKEICLYVSPTFNEAIDSEVRIRPGKAEMRAWPPCIAIACAQVKGVCAPGKDVMEADPFVAWVKLEMMENIQCKRVLILSMSCSNSPLLSQ